MDTTKLKKFAQYARTLLIEQVGTKLNQVLAAESPARREAPQAITSLESQVKKLGETQLIEQVAYTWFNRFCALRFMDVNGYNRVQVLSPLPGQFQPEILTEAKMGLIDDEHGTPAIRHRINDLLGSKIQSHDPQGEAYRLLVVAACNSWHSVMPFMFEKIADYTELLLPDDLLSGNSILSYTREALTAANCSPENTDESVEVLGWLYQFYIAEKKDAVMARKKAVPSEDIPAVTQLFTPHWIVRYLVENSLGRLWLRSRPSSNLRKHMPYYVEDPEGQEPADSLTVATPGEIKLLDPACGSGHMLTYAFDLLVKIYEEENYAPSEIWEKILTHNLFGLEICPRAAQLAQFALVCKARQQSRTAFRRPVQPQVMCLQNVVITPEEMQAWSAATGVKLGQDELAQIHQFRENTETFGSLIQPVLDVAALALLHEKIQHSELKIQNSGDLLVAVTHRKLRLVLAQAVMLSQRYQVVVANPPYMGSGAMASTLLKFVKVKFPDSRFDLMACFMEQSQNLAGFSGFVGMINQHSWMFLRSYTGLREKLLGNARFESMLHLGPRTFPEISGEIVQSVAFVLSGPSPQRATSFQRLVKFSTSNQKEAHRADPDFRFILCQEEFGKLPDSMFGYWLGEASRNAFSDPKLGGLIPARRGLQTGDAPRFIREWHEIEKSATYWGKEERESCIESGARWYRFNNGGEYCRWYGNLEYVVNWRDDGHDIKATGKAIIPSEHLYFLPAITWSRLSGGKTAFRLMDRGIIPGDTGPCAFPESDRDAVLSYLNSAVSKHFLSFLVPTMTFLTGDIENMPFCPSRLTERREQMASVVQQALIFSRRNWDNFETSWDFFDLPLLRSGDWKVEPSETGGPWKGPTLAESWDHYATYCTAAIRCMQELETENNRLWIDAYGLQDELEAEVDEKEITLARADQQKDMAAFLSYAVGCMMGRYSLDQPGLILADADDTLEQYFEKINKTESEVSFLPDDDSIVPILEGEWFDDDITERFKKFLKACFDEEHYEENLEWLENALYPTNLEGKKRKTIRDYFLKDFYTDHVKTYKKRPIYWLFSSPKGSFNALVYLHRYQPDTVSLVLNDYLREFKTKLTAKMENLQHLEASPDASKKDKADALKEIAKIKKILIELNDWEKDTLFPLAQDPPLIDLDDGVKHNYPLFGKALKKIPGLS